MLRALLMVGIGGFFGSVARYGVKLLTDKFLPDGFPYATLIVNLLGCFIIGLLFGMVGNKQIGNNTWLVFATGFCGAFTTFSTFALENNVLAADGQSNSAIVYTVISLVVGLLLCRLGMGLVR
ncbi:MAG: fluoride efflux transporter CrcB [Chitinophagales bacterium]|nr:fluoride efflux transporter CrcB [Chitinophagaceae bacterium]MCB9063610.1 fluoride efflux transporter CrcB [Chitinophagales bacterium]